MFKKNFWKYLIADSIFLTLTFFLLVYAKHKVENFFILFENYQAELEIIEPELANKTIEGLLGFEQIMDGLNASVTSTYLFILVIVPIIIYLLFALTQSFNLSLAIDKKFNLKYFLKFLLYGIPFFGVLYLLMDFFFRYLSSFVYESGYSIIGMTAFILLIFVEFFVWMSFVRNEYRFKGIFNDIKKKVLPFTGMFILGLLGLCVFGVLYVRYLTDSFFGYSWVLMILFSLLLLFGLGFFRERFFR